MIAELGILLMSFKDTFPRMATFHWFVVAVFGFIVRLDHHGVSSSIRWLRIQDDLYETFLAFFRSDGLKINAILKHWQSLVAKRFAIRTDGGAFVLIGDGIKVAKEATYMPGVKKLHQESDNSGKASWIFGHHFGIIGMLAGSAAKAFCIPIAAEIHEGVPALRALQGKKPPMVDGIEKTSVATLMADLLVTATCNLGKPCIAVLDAYFAVAPVFKVARTLISDNGNRLLHIITRAKNNIVAYETTPLTYCGRGRRPTYGKKVKLEELFTSRKKEFKPVAVNVYGDVKIVSILCLDLLWKPFGDILRFVLVKDGEQTFILICSDLTISPEEIVGLYAKRFKIEVTFKMLKHIIGGFCYHFWTKAWTIQKGKPLDVSQVQKMSKDTQTKITNAMNAVEAFVNLAMIAAGLLQLIAIEHSETVRQRYVWWMRTYSSAVPSEEMVKSVIQHEFYHHFRRFKHTGIYQIIQSKRRPVQACQLKKAA